MKKILMSLGSILVLLLCSNAFAEGPYMSVNLGYSQLSDSHLIGTNCYTEGYPCPSMDLEFDDGYAFGIAVGHAMDVGRFELALDYKTHEITDIKNVHQAGINWGDFKGGGDVSSLSVMLNGYYDIDVVPMFTPYVTGGIGYSRITVTNMTADGENLVTSQQTGEGSGEIDDNIFAYQLGAGVGIDITETLTLDVGYRYFTTQDVQPDDIFVMEYETHNVMVGLRVAL